MKFTLEIELGKPSMRTAWQVHHALWMLADRINNYNEGPIWDSVKPLVGTIADENGNAVGKWEVVSDVLDPHEESHASDCAKRFHPASECTCGLSGRIAKSEETESNAEVVQKPACEFRGAINLPLVAVLKADPDQKVCSACHLDPRVPTSLRD